MGISGGRAKLDELFTWTFVAMLLLVPAWSWIVARFPRRRIIPIAYHVFAACLVGFAAAWAYGLDRPVLSRIFFVWLSVYNVFVVSVFWSFMADVFDSGQAKRLYGFIAAGGSAGAIAGPLATALLVERLGLAPMLLLAAILLELCVLCVAALVRWSREARPGALSRHADQRIGGSAFAGFGLMVRSPYLLAIGGQIVLYAIVSTILYFEQARMVEAALPDPAARTALFAKVDLSINVLNVLIELLATGFVMTAGSRRGFGHPSGAHHRGKLRPGGQHDVTYPDRRGRGPPRGSLRDRPAGVRGPLHRGRSGRKVQGQESHRHRGLPRRRRGGGLVTLRSRGSGYRGVGHRAGDGAARGARNSPRHLSRPPPG